MTPESKRQSHSQRIDPRLKVADWDIATFTTEAVA